MESAIIAAIVAGTAALAYHFGRASGRQSERLESLERKVERLLARQRLRDAMLPEERAT